MKKEKVTSLCPLTGNGLRLNLVHVLTNAKDAYDPAIKRSIISDQRVMDIYSAFPLPREAPCAFADAIKRIHQISIPPLVMHGKMISLIHPKQLKYFLRP